MSHAKSRALPVHSPWMVGVTTAHHGPVAFTVSEHTHTLVAFDRERYSDPDDKGGQDEDGYLVDPSRADFMDHTVATARLIAAAPELDEAAQAAYRLLTASPRQPGAIEEAAKMLREALTAAWGETPD